MRRSPVRLAQLLAIVTAVTLLFSPATAVAGGTPPVVQSDPPPITAAWFATPCATGEIDPPVFAANYLFVTAEITNCGPDWSMHRFALVAFRADRPAARAYYGQLRPYLVDAPTPVSAYTYGLIEPGELGICLMRTIAAPVACLRVTIDADLDMTWEPLATNDPLVTKPIILFDEGTIGDPGGFCGTCFRMA
jgi:hypothetical protein